MVKRANDICLIKKTINGVIYKYERDQMSYKFTMVPSSQTNDQSFSILTALDLEDGVLTRGNKFAGVVSGKDSYNLNELLETEPEDGLQVEVLNERVDKTSSVFELEYSYGGNDYYSEYFSVSDKVQ